MNDYDKLLQYAFNLLAKKRYTSSELRKKLEQYVARHDMEDSALVETAVSRLFELKYLDDNQFVHDYISDRVRFRPRGKFQVVAELGRKGIDKSLVEKIWESTVNDLEVAISALGKRERQWRGFEAKVVREKAFRYLAAKGFSPDTIYKAIESCYSRDSE